MHICGHEIFPSFNNETNKVILGAIIGFAPAVLVAMYTQFRTDKRENEKRELEERKSKLADAKYVFLHSVRLLNSVILTSKAYLLQANKIDNDQTQPLWTKILPVMNLPSENPRFNIDRLGFLLEAGFSSIVNDLLDLESIENSILQICHQYNNLREELASEIYQSPDSKSRIVGNMVSQYIRPELFKKHHPSITKLNDLTKSMLISMKEGSKHALNISRTLGKILEVAAGKDTFSYQIEEFDYSFLNEIK